MRLHKLLKIVRYCVIGLIIMLVASTAIGGAASFVGSLLPTKKAVEAKATDMVADAVVSSVTDETEEPGFAEKILDKIVN